MRVAIPVRNESFCAHFGQCEGVYLCELDVERHKIRQPRVISRQAHGCESLPKWLAELGVKRVLAGGIGASAIQGLADQGIDVVVGLIGDIPSDVTKNYLSQPNALLNNPCEGHSHEHHHCRSN